MKKISLLIIILVLIVGVWLYWRNKSAYSTDKTFSWHNISFKYPSGWTAWLDTFTTSKGIGGESGGLYVCREGTNIYVNENYKNCVIGSVVSCSVMQSNPVKRYRCKDVPHPLDFSDYSISTVSTDTQVLAVFNEVSQTFKIQN